MADEEIELLLFSAEDPVGITPEESDEVITPLPRLQIGILVLVLLAEPICSQCIYPFINQVTPLLNRTSVHVSCIFSSSASWVSQVATRRKSGTMQVSKRKPRGIHTLDLEAVLLGIIVRSLYSPGWVCLNPPRNPYSSSRKLRVLFCGAASQIT